MPFARPLSYTQQPTHFPLAHVLAFHDLLSTSLPLSILLLHPLLIQVIRMHLLLRLGPGLSRTRVGTRSAHPARTTSRAALGPALIVLLLLHLALKLVVVLVVVVTVVMVVVAVLVTGTVFVTMMVMMAVFRVGAAAGACRAAAGLGLRVAFAAGSGAALAGSGLACGGAEVCWVKHFCVSDCRFEICCFNDLSPGLVKFCMR